VATAAPGNLVARIPKTIHPGLATGVAAAVRPRKAPVPAKVY
jgi:hypothetical protein